MTLTEELTQEMLKSWEQDALTERALEIFKMQAETYNKICLSGSNPEDCVQAAVDMIKIHWKRLPPSSASITGSYYGQILKSGYISKLKKWD